MRRSRSHGRGFLFAPLVRQLQSLVPRSSLACPRSCWKTMASRSRISDAISHRRSCTRRRSATTRRPELRTTGPWSPTPGRRPAVRPRTSGSSGSPQSEQDIWWGPVNIGLRRAQLRDQPPTGDRLISNTRDRLYCFDGFAGWDPKYRVKVRVICARPYHALFMHTMLIRPTAEELADVRPARLRDLQRRPVSGQPPHRRHDLEDQHRSGFRGRRSW